MKYGMILKELKWDRCIV